MYVNQTLSISVGQSGVTENNFCTNCLISVIMILNYKNIYWNCLKSKTNALKIWSWFGNNIKRKASVQLPIRLSFITWPFIDLIEVVVLFFAAEPVAVWGRVNFVIHEEVSPVRYCKMENILKNSEWLEDSIKSLKSRDFQIYKY